MRMLSDVAVIGFIMALASVPLALGWVPRNRVYGFRVGATLKDDRVWCATNRRMGVEMIAVGLALWGMTELLGRSGMDESTAGRIAWVTLIVVTVLFIVRGWKYANRVARQAPRVSAYSVPPCEPVTSASAAAWACADTNRTISRSAQ